MKTFHKAVTRSAFLALLSVGAVQGAIADTIATHQETSADAFTWTVSGIGTNGTLKLNYLAQDVALDVEGTTYTNLDFSLNTDLTATYVGSAGDVSAYTLGGGTISYYTVGQQANPLFTVTFNSADMTIPGGFGQQADIFAGTSVSFGGSAIHQSYDNAQFAYTFGKDDNGKFKASFTSSGDSKIETAPEPISTMLGLAGVGAFLRKRMKRSAK